ncbi:Cytochrome P450 52A13 [Neofusicoccum parvum]|uniref:Cytochrome P450 52A13 n=1 Tax=Neofusicoccum parvum TaxID=310453 RepID=A0ACB5SNN7_9PEZI|nr:Cytochrome P450 52A13 [Neofusicoccum parvum]
MIQEPSLPVLIAATVAAAWTVTFTFTFIKEEIKIRTLGGHAESLRSLLPFGLSFIFQIISHSLRDENLEFMYEQFERTTNARNHTFTFETRLCGTRWVFTADPENVKAMLATQFSEYGKGARMHRDWNDLMGDSIFTADGQRWHESRQLVRKYFTKERISGLNCFERHVQEMIPLLGNGRTVDVKVIFSRFALDASGDFSFGRSFNALKDRQNDFSDAFDFIRHKQALIERAGPLNFLVPRREFRRRVGALKEFIKSNVVDAAALTPEELQTRDKKDEDYTFLHSCASSTSDEKLLLDEVVTVLIAGRDTTAMTLSFCFFELARNPAVVEDLRREIEQYLGFDRMPTYSDLKMTRVYRVEVGQMETHPWESQEGRLLSTQLTYFI